MDRIDRLPCRLKKLPSVTSRISLSCPWLNPNTRTSNKSITLTDGGGAGGAGPQPAGQGPRFVCLEAGHMKKRWLEAKGFLWMRRVAIDRWRAWIDERGKASFVRV